MKKLTRFEIDRFDEKDHRVETFCGTLQELAEHVPDYQLFYYRPSFFRYGGIKTSRDWIEDIHFGTKVSAMGSLTISMPYFIEAYLNYIIKQFELLSDTVKERDYMLATLARIGWYEKQMQNLSQSPKKDLDEAIQLFLNANENAREITELKEISKRSGIYMLVLDRYNACYIGQSSDMARRIKVHWGRKNYFTGTGIDMFRAKDTTRIYALDIIDEKKINEVEFDLVNSIAPHTTINVINGGTVDYLLTENRPLFKKKN